MFLKSLEIRGFKSFADKTELSFKKGITAVVGPNGSGKSNISDAVKWVLGEQSVKNLRGGKMQDVIFAGTQYRKPVGLAQVTLVLDNEDSKLPVDYNDVTITRRIFRSGESEYYLNNTKCRLKDIHELFMDTGIGKEGYSIIGQGKIEAVLSGKPEERRSLLEEAAGIVKFKTRKQEAEKKLENTDQNIQRINDIFSTYEERLEPLKIENEKAEKFLQLSQNLKGKEATAILYNIDNLQEKINDLKKQIEVNDSLIKKLYTQKDTIKDSLALANDKLEKFESENNEERKKYYDNKTLSQNLTSEIQLFQERIKNLEESMNKTSRTVQQLDEKLNLLKNEQDKEKISLENLKVKHNSIVEQLFILEKDIAKSSGIIEDKVKVLKESKNYQVQLISEITKNKNELIILESDINSLKDKLQECKDTCSTYTNSIKINYTTKDILSKEIYNIENKIKEYESGISEYKKVITTESRNVIHSESKLKQLVNQYNKLEANRNALINLEKQYEGYTKAVKNLMQHIYDNKINKAKGKTCVVGDIISVSKRFETATEIALGGYISNIITDDEAIAKELIVYLKKNHLGRATFLPLNIIKSKKISVRHKIVSTPGYIGIASELIEYDDKYKNAIEYVLGRTVIAENMDSALMIAKESGYSFKIVTLDGEVINVGGALTGGSVYHRSTSIISRKREIQEISSKLEDNDRVIKDLSDTIKSKRENIKNMDNTCLNLKDEIHYENIEKTKIIEKIHAIDNESAKLKRDLEVSNNEITLIKENVEQSSKEIQSKNKKINDLIQVEKDNNNKIVDLEENLTHQEENIKFKNEDITSLKIEKAKYDENILNTKNTLNRIEKEIETINEEISVLNKENNEWIKSIEDAKIRISKNKKKITEVNNEINVLEQKFKESDITRITIKENIKKLTEELENVNLECDKNERKKNNIQISLTRYEVEKENLYTKLNDEMKLTYAEALELKIQDISIEQCKKDIEFYKNEISKLGVVNLGAIEEYKQLVEKYIFMKNQKDDLVKAKEELENVVFEMTDKMKTVFKENFEKLRKNFNETFRQLFKGGNADLILGEGDALSANIEINVQPPGKKLQNINLMSGGEKGLSAIALLFAILKMKPTPFCILDEIEAALDDSNVTRYAEFLRKFSCNTQFIIITHRKGSMEASDILYGVTMEEKGISKIVSVDLNKQN